MRRRSSQGPQGGGTEGVVCGGVLLSTISERPGHLILLLPDFFIFKCKNNVCSGAFLAVF